MKLVEIGESIRIAFESLKANALRSFLTSFGVVIGIAFVVLMGWFLDGLDTALEKTINIIGSDMLWVDKWNWAGGNSWRKSMARKDITYQQTLKFCREIKTAELAMPTARRWGSSITLRNRQISGIAVMGVPAEYALTPAGTVNSGRFFSRFEDYSSQNVVVIGYNVERYLFPSGDAIGKQVKIAGRTFTIVGAIERRGTILMDFVDNQVFIPLSTFMGIFGATGRLSIAVKAGSLGNMENVRMETIGLMRNIRNVPPGEEEDFSINETQMFRDQLAKLRLSTWGVGLGLTVLSFVVGIIGIMNIMFVSVTQRTKEIGIRKALGATRASVILQFLSESAALCFSGAIVAFVGCSILIAVAGLVVTKFYPDVDFLSPYIPPSLLIVASAVSIFVGLLAGLIPALRAANLDPVEALRYE